MFHYPRDKINKINLNQTRPKSDARASTINNKVFVSKFIQHFIKSTVLGGQNRRGGLMNVSVTESSYTR